MTTADLSHKYGATISSFVHFASCYMYCTGLVGYIGHSPSRKQLLNYRLKFHMLPLCVNNNGKMAWRHHAFGKVHVYVHVSSETSCLSMNFFKKEYHFTAGFTHIVF